MNNNQELKIICPVARIKNKNFKLYAKECIERLLKNDDKSNIIVVRRFINEDEIDCGIFLFDAITDNELKEDLMQAFW